MLNTHARASNVEVRPLTKQDLDAVVALDRRITGGPRRGYFQRRLDAAIRWPRRHLQVAAWYEGALVGFVLSRRAGGEYGRPEAFVVLETVGVDPTAQHHGVGQKLVGTLADLMREREVHRLVTQVDWRNHNMLRFLDGAGFALEPRLLLSRDVHRMPLPPTDEEIETFPPVVRVLREEDLEQVARIDRQITGEDRAEYLRRKFDEALAESSIRVSLVAEDDGFVVAFAMARIDVGDFGHVEPTASLDTIGVSPGFAHRGFARATLTQMVDNLAALHVERLETEIAHDAFDLARFLHEFGFAPSQRLSFGKRV
jgi:ribosomal protein S18 acetylase RimI-like enzyme